MDTGSTTATSTREYVSVLRYTRLVNTTDGINIIGRPPHLDHVTVFNSATSGVSLLGFFQGNITVSHCNFSSNQRHGIYFNLDNSKANVHVTNTTMIGNGEAGMTLQRGTSGTVRLLNNTIHSNLRYGLNSQETIATLIVANNSFINNSHNVDQEGTAVRASQVIHVHYRNVTHLKVSPSPKMPILYFYLPL